MGRETELVGKGGHSCDPGVTWEVEPFQGCPRVCSTRPPSLIPVILSLRTAGLEGPQPVRAHSGDKSPLSAERFRLACLTQRWYLCVLGISWPSG